MFVLSLGMDFRTGELDVKIPTLLLTSCVILATSGNPSGNQYPHLLSEDNKMFHVYLIINQNKFEWTE